MSKGKNQKVTFVGESGTQTLTLGRADPEADNDADIDRVIDILNGLPALRRYGKDEEAIEEAKAAMLRIKGRA